MESVSNYKYTTQARIINKSLQSYGKVVTIIKKVNRFKYLIEYSPGGRSYYMDVNSLELI